MNISPVALDYEPFSDVHSTYRMLVQTSNGKEIRKESLVPPNVTHLQIHSSMPNVPSSKFRRYEALQFVSFLSPDQRPSGDDSGKEKAFPLPSVYLGREVFWECRSLTHVKFPSDMNLIEIPSHCFAYCFSLYSVELPEDQSSLKVIGECAFLFCESLEELRVPNSVVEIQRQAFFECRRLRKVKMPNRLEMIGKESFAYCHQLEHVILSSTVHTLGINVFHNCRSLAILDLDDSQAKNDRQKFALAIQLCVLYPEETKVKIPMERLVHQYTRTKIKPSELLTGTPAEMKKLKEIELAYIDAIRELVLWSVSIAGLIR